MEGNSCCDYKRKYEEIYGILSSERIENRSMKEELDIKNTMVQGLFDQNNTLKDILARKNQMILKLNNELSLNGLEIERLEDEVKNLQDSENIMNEKVSHYESSLKQ